MAITRIESSVDIHAAAFDTLTRTLDCRHHRRQVFGLLAASLATGVLGTASRSQEAAAKGKRKKNGGKKRGKKGGKGSDTGNGNTPGTTPPVLQTCAAAAECGADPEGNMCACRTDSTNQKICTRINGRFLATGTCGECQGAEQCIPVVSGGVECILPCKE
ncbi:MAG: hypothetical protein KY456_06450 [Chloroflexi bacterium]|nr:hypothetical protein [Chloroflexota bacterium]